MQKASCENCAWRDDPEKLKCSYCGIYPHLVEVIDGKPILNAYWDGNPVIEKLSNGDYQPISYFDDNPYVMMEPVIPTGTLDFTVVGDTIVEDTKVTGSEY